MRKFLIISALTTAIAMTVVPAKAGISSGLSSGLLITVAVAQPRTVSVYLTIPADFVSVPLRIFSDQKNTALAYDELRQAVELVRQKAVENGQFQISQGVVSLSQRQSGFGLSSGSWNQPAASAEIYILVPFTNGCTNIFAAGTEAARFVETLHFPGKARYELGYLQLAVENPEQYRRKLLDLIAGDIAKTRGSLATNGGMKVEGLEGPVMVRQADDRQIELYLNYALSITSNK
jgi:hypothetical protein